MSVIISLQINILICIFVRKTLLDRTYQMKFAKTRGLSLTRESPFVYHFYIILDKK